ncbi:MAG: hypothetical protein AB1505_32200 [Candidatus Latescibacterota bacterium]
MSRPEGCDWEGFDAALERLRQASEECRRAHIVRLLGEILPEYRPALAPAAAPAPLPAPLAPGAA